MDVLINGLEDDDGDDTNEERWNLLLGEIKVKFL